MKPLTKTTIFLILLYLILSTISAFTNNLFGFGMFIGIITVIITSYFVSKFKRSISWKEALFFSGILLIIRFISWGLSSILGHEIYLSYTLFFFILYFVIELILFKYLSKWFLIGKRIERKYQ